MKAADVYVPFLLFKTIFNFQNHEYSGMQISKKISNNQYWERNLPHIYFWKYVKKNLGFRIYLVIYIPEMERTHP